MGIHGVSPGQDTRRRHSEHIVYPYLLLGMAMVKPDQVWSTGITCIRLAQGFAYRVAILDWFSRYVLFFRLSNGLEATLLSRGARRSLGDRYDGDFKYGSSKCEIRGGLSQGVFDDGRGAGGSKALFSVLQ